MLSALSTTSIVYFICIYYLCFIYALFAICTLSNLFASTSISTSIFISTIPGLFALSTTSIAYSICFCDLYLVRYIKVFCQLSIVYVLFALSRSEFISVSVFAMPKISLLFITFMTCSICIYYLCLI